MSKIFKMWQIFAVLVWAFANCGQSTKLPENFPVCQLIREKLPKCFAKAVEDTLLILKNPVPELGIPSIDPIEVESLQMDGGSGRISLNQTFTNIKIYNMENTKVPKVEFNIDGSSFENVLYTFVPEMRIVADYKMSGKILMLPIGGSGKLKLDIYNLTTVVSMSANQVTKKGKMYLKIQNTSCSLSPEFVKMNLDTSLTEEKTISNYMNQILNENWKEIFSDFKAGYEEILGKYLRNIAETVFDKVEFKYLFPPP